jgi:hypothetical protein
MIKTRMIETAIDENGNSYIFSDKEKSGWNLPGHIIVELPKQFNRIDTVQPD